MLRLHRRWGEEHLMDFLLQWFGDWVMDYLQLLDELE